MKFAQFIPAITALLVTGCVYEYPLTTEHNIPIDPAILGLWKFIPDESDEPEPPEERKEPEPDELMMILKFSDTEYMIQFMVKDVVYNRGYPIKIGDVSCVQLEAIGSEAGPFEKDIKTLFNVMSLASENDELVMRFINTDLVDTDLESIEALKEAFLKNQDSEDLFMDSVKFRRVED